MNHHLVRVPSAALLLVASFSWAQPAPTEPSPVPTAAPSPSSADPSQEAEQGTPSQEGSVPQPHQQAAQHTAQAEPGDASSPATLPPVSSVPLDDSAPTADGAAPAAAARTTAPPSAAAPADDYEGASSAPLDDSRLKGQNPPPGIRFLLGILYDTGLPLGRTQDFNRRFSGRGFTVEGSFRSQRGLRAGVSFGFQVFQEKVDRTITYGDATVGGVQVRETSLSPMTAHFAYALEKLEKVVPYLRLGVGGGRVWRRLDIGIRRFVDESWHFALVPELGVEVPAGRVLVLGAVRYNYFFKGDGAPAQSYMNFSAGLGFD